MQQFHHQNASCFLNNNLSQFYYLQSLLYYVYLDATLTNINKELSILHQAIKSSNDVCRLDF